MAPSAEASETAAHEPDAAATQVPPSAWNWDGCAKRTTKSLILDCREKKVTVSIGRVPAATKPTPAELQEAEQIVLESMLSGMPADADVSESSIFQTQMQLPKGPVSMLATPLAAGPMKGATGYALALPYEDEGAHFIVVYNCISLDKKRCPAALASLLTEGVPQLP